MAKYKAIYCNDCGGLVENPYVFRNCKKCMAKVKAGTVFSECQRCKKPKNSDKKGLCPECSAIIKRANNNIYD